MARVTIAELTERITDLEGQLAATRAELDAARVSTAARNSAMAAHLAAAQGALGRLGSIVADGEAPRGSAS